MPPSTKFQRPTAVRGKPSTTTAANPDFDGIFALAATLNGLHKQIAANCAPIVQRMIKSRTRDQQQIEHMLDRLLDCACIPEGLTLFRALCRYYFTLNPVATADYVHSYREMWDSENDENLDPKTGIKAINP